MIKGKYRSKTMGGLFDSTNDDYVLYVEVDEAADIIRLVWNNSRPTLTSWTVSNARDYISYGDWIEYNSSPFLYDNEDLFNNSLC